MSTGHSADKLQRLPDEHCPELYWKWIVGIGGIVAKGCATVHS